MTQSVSAKKAMANGSQKNSNGSAQASTKPAGKSNPKPIQARKAQRNRPSAYAAPSWLGALVSVIGVGVAIGAGLYATRDQWMPTADNGKMIFPLPLPMMKPILRILTKPATPARIPCVIIRAKIGTRLMTCPMRPSPQATRHRSRQRLHHERRLE